MKWICHPSLDSTSKEAQRLLQAGEKPPFGVWAFHQTCGVGQVGRVWQTLPGDLTFSLVTEFSEGPLPLRVAHSLAQSLWEKFGQAVVIKWPNDLFYKGLKQGGILCQKYENHLIVGVGLNLKPKPEGISWQERENTHPDAWSLAQILAEDLLMLPAWDLSLYERFSIPASHLWRDKQELGPWLQGRVQEDGSFCLGEETFLSGRSLQWFYQGKKDVPWKREPPFLMPFG